MNKKFNETLKIEAIQKKFIKKFRSRLMHHVFPKVRKKFKKWPIQLFKNNIEPHTQFLSTGHFGLLNKTIMFWSPSISYEIFHSENTISGKSLLFLLQIPS